MEWLKNIKCIKEKCPHYFIHRYSKGKAYCKLIEIGSEINEVCRAVQLFEDLKEKAKIVDKTIDFVILNQSI